MCDPPISSRGAARRADDGRPRGRGSDPCRAAVRRRRGRPHRKVAPHPERRPAARMHGRRGTRERLTIVCGAPNAAAGMNAPLRAGRRGPARRAGDQARVHARRGLAGHAVLGEGARPRRRCVRPACPARATLAPGSSVREALALDDTLLHAQAHAEPRRLPVGPRALRAKSRRSRGAPLSVPRVRRHAGHVRRRAHRCASRISPPARASRPRDRRHRSERRQRPPG